MRVLVTGAGGQVGQALAEALVDDEVIGLSHAELDITDEPAVVAALERAAPDVVVHTAALTKVDACESEVEQAWQANAAGAWWVARACALVGAAMVHLSTDYVFDGAAQRPYTEFDTTNPQSVYGATKRAGEQLVRETLAEHYIVRASWVQGVHGANFVKTMLRLGAERDRLEVVDDQTGAPTFAFDLAPALRALAASGRYGTYHLTNTGQCTWYELAGAIFEDAGLSVELAPTDTASFGAPAPRPAFSVLDNRMAGLVGLPPLPHWRDSLRTLLTRLRRGG